LSRRIARPYAAALFEVLKREEVAALRAAEGELAQVLAVFSQVPELLRVFEVPAVPPAKKRELLAAVVSGLGLRGPVARLLGALAEHMRLRFLGEVVEAFRALVDRREGVTRGQVETPAALADDQKNALADALAALTGAHVELAAMVRPELLAGFVVRMGSQVFDGSLAAQLRRFAAEAAARS
jgi:F-type H+-transporting ATPase subunit delta